MKTQVVEPAGGRHSRVLLFRGEPPNEAMDPGPHIAAATAVARSPGLMLVLLLVLVLVACTCGTRRVRTMTATSVIVAMARRYLRQSLHRRGCDFGSIAFPFIHALASRC